MNTKKLKQLVLDLAIHGKLVPQDPNDEPASELLKRIVETHGRASNKSKGKKSAISSEEIDEVPFEVPRGWVLTTIGEILINRDSERKPVSSSIRKIQTERIYDYYGATGVVDKIESYLFDERLLLIGEDGANLLSRSKDNAFFAEGKYWVNNHAHVLDCKEKVVLDFVAIVINSMPLDDFITGSAQPKLSQDNLNKIRIPLPPLSEQKRIVSEIEKWFAVIDELEGNEADLRKSIEQTKKKVLDLAIHGKLVPQDPNDEPASKLLKRIVETRGRASNIGRASKQTKTKSAISSDNLDEVPFEVPEGWVWCRLPDICAIPITDGTHQTPTYSDKENGIPFLSSKDVTSRRIEWSNIKYITKELHTELYKRIAPQKNDILLAKNGTTGVAAIVEDDRIFDIYVTLAVIRPIEEIVYPLYLLHVINSKFCKEQFNTHLTGIGLPNLHLTDIKKTIIPLPPLSEQRRIVAKIEEVFGELDRIEEMIG